MKIFLPLTLAASLMLLAGCQSSSSPFEKKFMLIDANKDGSISSAEFSQTVARDSFSGRDANKDGVITANEWKASGGSGSIFRMVDANGDGKIAHGEHARVAKPGGGSNIFNVIDANNDGKISRLEASSHEQFREAAPIR